MGGGRWEVGGERVEMGGGGGMGYTQSRVVTKTWSCPDARHARHRPTPLFHSPSTSTQTKTRHCKQAERSTLLPPPLHTKA